MNVTASEREDIEEATRAQAQSYLWYLVRARKITGSTCGKILCQQDPTPALLKSVLYSKPFEHVPPPIKWGIENEAKANQEYVRYSRSNGKTTLTMQKCGFIIHPKMGWFGASPDARVSDADSELPQGIAEFKCPYSKRDVMPQKTCKDPNFFCFHDSNGLHLKKSHCYYHQVQMQLFVGTDLYDWCDFCVYTPKGIAVERISLDIEWCDVGIAELDSYYDAHILPEILAPMYKPSYVL